MQRIRLPRIGLIACVLVLLPSGAAGDRASCLEQAGLPRVARVRAPDGNAVYARVVEHHQGVPTLVRPLADATVALDQVFDRASEPIAPDVAVWRIGENERASHICAPVRLPQRLIDAETRVVVAAGLNYAAHADEAGGGDVFLFPKPVQPSAPYGVVAPPDGVTLLDYEVELAYVLLSDVDLADRPGHETFLANTAFFVVNDITDREAIIREVGFSPPGSGFVEAKGQPNFLPAGPWMVRGRELFGALERCGEDGFGIRLEVDEGNGFVTRQDATTAAMIVKPLALLAKIARQIETTGLRTTMSVERPEGKRFYPFAVPRGEPASATIPAGSIVITGTPEGVAMQAPSIAGVLLRGLLRLRGPLEQFRLEQIARAKKGAPGGYLAPGDRVRASIDGLGAQIFAIEPAGSSVQRDPCDTRGSSLR